MAIEHIADQVGHIQPQLKGTNDRIIGLWLSRKSKKTQKAYLTDVSHFLDFVDHKHLSLITLPDFIDYQATLDHLAKSTQARKIAGVRSLFTFAHKAGFLLVNVGSAVEVPKVPNQLAQRILTEAEVIRMIDNTEKRRDKILLHLIYSTGLRVEEVHKLRWKHVSDGVLTVHGKGEHTRFLKLSESANELLVNYREGAKDDDPIFLSQKGNPLSTTRIWRIAKQAAKRVGIEKDVSPHFLRHSHATHALDRGAPIHLIQAQLGHASLAETSKYIHVRPGESSSEYLAI